MSKTLDLGAVTAYALAVKNGFTGTEAEWLASLKGADGVSPTAENISSALGYTPAKQTDVDTLSQNLALKTGMYYGNTVKTNTSIHFQAVSLSFTTAEQTAHLTFEASFPTACAGVFCQVQSGFTTFKPIVAVTNKTATGCDLAYSANTAFTVVVDLLAIGY